MQKVMATGQLDCDIKPRAKSAIEAFLPENLKLFHLYSTGMEASEVAIRIARHITGKLGIVGFSRGMHGKSQATSYLSWDNGDNVRIADIYRLPYLDTLNSEAEILANVEATFLNHDIAAIFIEPMQGVGGGHKASDEFYSELRHICTRHKVLMVFDEVLTGFHRTGPAFYCSKLGLTPDILLIGKAFGNGFPVSGVVLDAAYMPLQTRFGLSSTYANNPLACAAAIATLAELERIDAERCVERIHNAFEHCLKEANGFAVRHQGAMCILQAPSNQIAQAAYSQISSQGFNLSISGPFLRFLPPYTITQPHLDKACGAIKSTLSDLTEKCEAHLND
jgi:acetylornithine/succinyldiaminopimelate/putrescine aminotransferase